MTHDVCQPTAPLHSSLPTFHAPKEYPTMPLLDGKAALVYGVANHRSFAWHIAQALAREGARLCLTYQGERLEKNVRELGQTIPGTLFANCDVTRDEEVQAATDLAARELGRL